VAISASGAFLAYAEEDVEDHGALFASAAGLSETPTSMSATP
jgi:hypothetical protein